MSREIPDDEEIPLPPRHGPARPRKASDDDAELLDEASTFRPNAPKKKASRSTGAGPTANPRRATQADDERADRSGPSMFERLLFGSIGSGQLALFSRQFGTYMEAGVDLMKSLANLRKQFARTALGPVLDRMEAGVRRGDSLGDTMAREPQAFDPMYLGLMRVAEARGGIPETLRLLADHYEARKRMIRQARSALIYPAAVLMVASIVVMLMTYYILPMFAELLADLARGKGASSLPLPSRVLMAFSAFVRSYGWWLVPLLFFGGIFGSYRFYKTSAGKAMFDELAMYVPVLGALLRKIDTARFARTMSALQEGGLDIGASIDLSADVLTTAPYRKAIRGTKAIVMQGGLLSEALEASRRFPPDVISIVESGEETGKLPETLGKLADEYEEQVEYTVKNLGQLMQPIIVVLMGAMVLFIILAVFLPYISLLTSLGGG
ncbi:type II secretion system F family protein [Isosphaeraceae bacterium EP7]